MPGVYSGQGQEAPGAEKCGAGWNAFQDPSWCPLRAQVLPTGQRMGWCSLGADTLPARRALPHFLSCERPWVRSDWHGAAPANYKPGGQGSQARRQLFPSKWQSPPSPQTSTP